MKKDIYVKPYEFTDYEEVINLKLREADSIELLASTNLTGAEGLSYCLNYSDETYVAIVDDKIIAVFGISGKPPVGVPWFLATDEIYSVTKSFYQFAELFFTHWFSDEGGFHLLSNFVAKNNIKSIGWLKHLGFKFSEETYLLADNKTEFIRFYKYRGD